MLPPRLIRRRTAPGGGCGWRSWLRPFRMGVAGWLAAVDDIDLVQAGHDADLVRTRLTGNPDIGGEQDGRDLLFRHDGQGRVHRRPAVERNRHRVHHVRFEPALPRRIAGHAQRRCRGQDGVAVRLQDCYLRHRILLAGARYFTGPEAETATVTGTVNSAPWPTTIRTEVR